METNLLRISCEFPVTCYWKMSTKWSSPPVIEKCLENDGVHCAVYRVKLSWKIEESILDK